MIFKLTPEKLIQFFTYEVNHELYVTGWEYEFGSFLGIIDYIIYTKPLFK